MLWFFRNKKLLSKICHGVAVKLSYCQELGGAEYLQGALPLSPPSPTPAPKVPAFQILVHELLESNLSPEKEVRWDEKEMYLHISIFNDISTGAGWVV